MTDYEYITASDLDSAWPNFELDLPLEPQPDGAANPFYVEPPGNPAEQLVKQLRRRYRQPPKYFFSGHRGCGKSTELRRLAVRPTILAKYWPVHFTIRDEADIHDLDFKDVLLAIGGRLFLTYRNEGGKLPDQLMSELNAWRGDVETEVRTILGDRISESEIGADVNTFFAKLGLKMKLEPATRGVYRQVFAHKLSELIEVINKIATIIHAVKKRAPLVLIDDLDKPDLERCREIFYNHRATMLQPNMPIVYTVSSSLFYSAEFEALRDRAIFLPCVRLHEQGMPETRVEEGYATMREFVHKRMRRELISDDGLDAAVWTSGGLFREMCRVMRSSIDRAEAAGRQRIEIEDVHKAEAEIRGEYRRFLTREQRAVLRTVHARNRYDEPEKIAPLLQTLAALHYDDNEQWCDAHPALYKLLEEGE